MKKKDTEILKLLFQRELTKIAGEGPRLASSGLLQKFSSEKPEEPE